MNENVDSNRFKQSGCFKKSSLHSYFEQMKKNLNKLDFHLKFYAKTAPSSSIVEWCYHLCLEAAGTEVPVPLDMKSRLSAMYRMLTREDWNEQQKALGRKHEIQDAEIMYRMALQEDKTKEVTALLDHLYQMQVVLTTPHYQDMATVPYATFDRFCVSLSGQIQDYRALFDLYMQETIIS